MKIVAIYIPMRTQSEGNIHEHWRKTHGRRKSQRDASRLFVKQRLDELSECSRYTIHLTRIAPRALDDGNLEFSFKAVQDGVADALGINDGNRRVVSWRYAQERRGKGEYGIEIRIEGEEPGQ